MYGTLVRILDTMVLGISKGKALHMSKHPKKQGYVIRSDFLDCWEKAYLFGSLIVLLRVNNPIPETPA